MVKLPRKDINECLMEGITEEVIWQCLEGAAFFDPEELYSAREFYQDTINAFYGKQQYHSYAVYVGHESLLDMTNSTAACIHTEWDHDYRMAWDETAKRNAEFIAAANPATVLALLDELEAAENRITELSHHLHCAHGFIEHTEAFGHEASNGILCCGDAQWNIDASKLVLAAAGKGEES